MNKYEIGIVDDHQLFAKSLSLLLDSFDRFTVTIDATGGEELQRRLNQMPRVPDIILLDVNMPGMGGITCASWISEQFPAIRIAALTSNDTDTAVTGMIRAGCCGYLLKNTHPNELEKALTAIAEKGYYNSDSNIDFKRLLRNEEKHAAISDRERKFLQYSATEFTYHHIAMLMNISRRSVETLRANMFGRLGVQNRAAMVLEAVRRGWVDL